MKRGYFSKKVVEWYHEHHRDLPWRNTQDAYKIWLSEIILQQTRVSQGLPYYEKFILRYPDLKSLAEAKEQEVLRLWQGLGYYTRALNLHKCAREVVKNFGGKFPRTFQELRRLPGIGDYTAAAIASFAFHEQVAAVDGNVFRVLSRIFGVEKDIGSLQGKKFFLELANQLVPSDQPADHNQAVMEFGAQHCLPQNPKCETCIFIKNCFAFQHSQTDLLPVKIKRAKTQKRFFFYFLVRKGNRILMTKRKESDIWKGLFDFPLLETPRAASSSKILRSEFPGLNSHQRDVLVSKHYKQVLTHQIIHARFIQINGSVSQALRSFPPLRKGKWFSANQVEKLPKPALITRYLQDQGIL